MAATPFTFTPTDFKDGSAGGTPITAAFLNSIQLAVADLLKSLPNYLVTASTDTPPSTPCTMTVVNNGVYGGVWYNDGSTVTRIMRPQGLVVKIVTDKFANSTSKTITAPTVDGYKFLMWFGAYSTGWVGSLYINGPDKSTSEVWNTGSANSGSFNVYALYQPA